MKNQATIYIGIDPGAQKKANNGFAKWDADEGRLLQVDTWNLHEVFAELRQLAFAWNSKLHVIVEDARPRSGKAEAKQGAGYIKAVCNAYQSLLQHLAKEHNISYEFKPPQKNQTKVSPKFFQQLTGWTGRTSSHARDAGMLVIGRKPKIYS